MKEESYFDEVFDNCEVLYLRHKLLVDKIKEFEGGMATAILHENNGIKRRIATNILHDFRNHFKEELE